MLDKIKINIIYSSTILEQFKLTEFSLARFDRFKLITYVSIT